MLSGPEWQFLVCRLLNVATGYMNTLLASLKNLFLTSGYLLGSKENLASSIRFIQVYTCQENYTANGLKIITNIYKFLIKDSYFAKIRHLVDTKIPPLLSLTTRPPTPISEEILQMILRPLDIIDSAQDKLFVNEILRQLCEQIFCKDFSDQVKNY